MATAMDVGPGGETGRLPDQRKQTPASESTESPPEAPKYVPPNGGIRAWLCVLGGFCCQFCSFGFLNACGIFQLYYETDILSNHTSSAISWIVTIQIFLMFSLGPIVGVLVDILGPRKLIFPASILALFGIFMLSLCNKYWQIMLAQGIVYGIGAAATFLPPLIVVGQWFSTKRGLATGLVASGSSLGGIIFPIVVSRLIAQVGFASALRWTGLLMACVLVIGNLCISGPIPPKGKSDRKLAGAKAFKSLAWILYSSGCFLMMWGLFAPINYLPLMALKAGASKMLSTYTISIANAASFFGRIIPGAISDRVGQLNVMISVAFLSGISILAFWLPVYFHPTNAAIIAFGVVYGMASGGFVSLMSPCVVTLCDGKSEELGPKLGAFMFVIAIASLTGLPISGAIKDASHNKSDFQGLICFSGVVMIVGGFLVSMARIRKGGMKMVKI
ncbi:hypothetical protein CISG_00756 [Coccidioides immitis RMSCC 3703]|uniref:Major facilitator superfamily (MFS) profile domain-containing protein n=1 Tax=Coccidioides immitis RMSCC 3703 TaxID=454286 RepID=A0A0J8QQQ1_COCIT|nr:hypothetical protein CISG_00756 [Coccidioides immitis RMSCC 3703]